VLRDRHFRVGEVSSGLSINTTSGHGQESHILNAYYGNTGVNGYDSLEAGQKMYIKKPINEPSEGTGNASTESSTKWGIYSPTTVRISGFEVYQMTYTVYEVSTDRFNFWYA
jgi:hypothetical protein